MASRFIRFNALDYRIYEKWQACLNHKLYPEHAIDMEKQANLIVALVRFNVTEGTSNYNEN